MNAKIFSKSILTKLVAVMVAVVLVITVAPTGVFNFAIDASAAQYEYDPSLGDYSESSGVLTATPKAGAGFRGWFNNEGVEVSYNPTFTIPSGAKASDYFPVFYDLELLKNGGFEDYANGTNLSLDSVPVDEQWNGVSDDRATWADEVTVTTANKRSGDKSILLNSFYNLTYKTIGNLKPNTLYTLTYYFNMVANTSGDYLTRSCIVGSDVSAQEVVCKTITPTYIDVAAFNSTTGVCASASEWKEVKHTFYTGDKTSVQLFIFYQNNQVVEGDNKSRAPFYVDDISLSENSLAVPSTYFNNDFSSGLPAGWTAVKTGANLNVESGKLKVTATANERAVQYRPFSAKKDATYTISFKVNLGTLVNTAANYINFSLTDTEGMATDNGYYIPTVTNSEGNAFDAKITQSSRSLAINYYPEITRTCFTWDSIDDNKFTVSSDITVQFTFTPSENTLVYLNAWSNYTGNYYIDDLTVTESNRPSDAQLAGQYGASLVGTAIRTEGEQGLRYKTEIDKKLLTYDNYYGLRVVEYGVVAIKTAYLNGSALELNKTYTYGGKTYAPKSGAAYKFDEQLDKVYADNDTTLEFTGVLTKISNSNYNTNYTVRAYFKYVTTSGATGTFYADQNDVAVYPVAKAAYSARKTDGSYTESETVRNFLYNEILKNFTDKIIKVSNGSNPIATNFEGIRSTVYHGTLFFEDSHGRKYSENEAEMEMDRLVDSKVDNVRTRFDSNWMWDDSTGWNWNSDKMNAFYKWGQMLNERDISVTLNVGWHLYDFICYYNKEHNTGIPDKEDPDISKGHSSIPEVDYLHGKGTSKYGEDTLAATIKSDAQTLGLNLNSTELEHYSLAAARYGTWVAQAVAQLKAKGVNVEYVMPFTESGDINTATTETRQDTTYSYDEWIIMTMGVQNALTNEGLRSSLDIIGPSQSLYANQNRTSLLEYVYSKISSSSKYANMIDVNSLHQYTRPNYEAGYPNTVYDPDSSYSLAEENFTYYNNILKNNGLRNQDFWCDEYFATAPDARWVNGIGMQMTQFAAGLTAGINNGVNRFSTWQMFDSLWDSEKTNTSGEFIGGVHAVGTCSSFVFADGDNCNIQGCACESYKQYSSYVPRTTYYGINLIGKYMNNEDATVYATEVVDAINSEGGIFVSAIVNDEGKTVILVVNTNSYLTTVDVQLENVGNTQSFNRYVYDPSAIIPTIEAKSIESDKELELSGDTFADAIPAQSFAIYVEGEPFVGSDVDVDFGGLNK